MTLIILLVIVVLVAIMVTGAIAVLASTKGGSRRQEKRVRDQGRPLQASLMMANNSLHDPAGSSAVPGVVVFGFYQPNPKLAATLAEIAQRCFDLYSTPEPRSLAPALHSFSLLLKDDIYRANRRNLVPPEVAGSAVVYVADLWVRRENLPAGWQEHRVLACAVTGADQGEIALLPPNDPAAVGVYTAAGISSLKPVGLDPMTYPASSAGHLSKATGGSTPALDRQSRGLLTVASFLVGGVALCILLCGMGIYIVRGVIARRLIDESRPVAAREDESRKPAMPPSYTVHPKSEPPRSPSPPSYTVHPQPKPVQPSSPPSYTIRPQPEPVQPSTSPSYTVRPAPRPPTSYLRPGRPSEQSGSSPPGFAPAVRTNASDGANPFQLVPDGDAADAPIETSASSDPRGQDAPTWGSDTLRIPFESEDEITFGRIGCPVVIVRNEVWHFEQKKIVQQLEGEYNERALKSLSGNGQWFAVASKSPNQQDTAIDVWNVVTGKPQCHIPGDPEKFADLIRFSRHRYLLIGGRHSAEIEVWDIEANRQMPSITAPERRVDDEHVTFTADGEYFTSVVDERLTVIQTKNGRRAAVMEAPQPTLDPQQPMNAVQKRMATDRVIRSIEIVRFSPNGQELAVVSDSHNPRLCCWSGRGELVFDKFIPRVQHAFFFSPTFDWLPDSSGWIVSGHIIDRKTKRIVMAVRLPFADDPLFFPLDRDRLVGAFPHDPEMLQVIEIPWEKIHASLQLLEDGSPALLSPAAPVSIELQLAGLRGDTSATESLLTDALSERLQADGLQIAAGRATFFRLRFSEQAGDTLPIYERQSPFDFRGHDTGRTAQEAEGTLIIELVANEQVLWRDSIKATSSSSFREEINDATIRQSMLENLARHMDRLSIPYFIPQSEDYLALPVVLE